LSGGPLGRLRVRMWEDALAAQRAGRVRVTEARASDFVGPESGAQAHLGDHLFPRVLAGKKVWVFGSTAYHVLVLGLPRAEVMGVVGLLALGANLASVLLLVRYKDGDANVRSVWLCSRNDAVGNVAVMIAALGVWGTATKWPDLIVAAIMAGLFLWSSSQILRQSWRELRTGAVATAHGRAH